MREALALAERAGDGTTRVRALNYLTVVERWRVNVAARAGTGEERARSVAERWVQFPVEEVLPWMPHWLLFGAALARDDDAEAADHARVIVDPACQPMPPDLQTMLAEAVSAWDDDDATAARASLLEAASVAAGYGL
jgi:hypothetical protein